MRTWPLRMFGSQQSLKLLESVARAGASLSRVGLRDGETLRVPVPAGTFVRTRNGRVLGDLVRPGEELLVARGGVGGPGEIPQPPTRAIGGRPDTSRWLESVQVLCRLR